MILLKRPCLAAIAALCFLLIATAYARQMQRETKGRFTEPSLGIEVSQKKSFFMQAATSKRISSVVLRVPYQAGTAVSRDSVSAIKLEPKVEKGKVRVNVYALYGDTQGIKRCEDLDALKTVKVDSIVAGLGKEVRVLKLRKYGVKMENDPFTFRVISKSIFAPNDPGPGSGCSCLSCELQTCCPNPGYCNNCDCGTICCRP